MMFLETQMNRLEKDLEPGEHLNAHVTFNGANYYTPQDHAANE